MNKLGQILAATLLGVGAAAAAVAFLGHQKRTTKVRDVEDIHRWEDEGGQVLARRQAPSDAGYPANPA